MSKMGGFGLQYYPYVSFVVIAFLKCVFYAVFGLECARFNREFELYEAENY